MTKNTGQSPNVAAPIDVQFRNGQIKRDVKAEQYRWEPWGWGQSDWDIVDWQFHAAEQTTHRKAA